MVMAGSLGIGYFQVVKDKMRISFLEEMQRDLTFLYGEMQFSGEEISRLFELLGQKDGLLCGFWQKVNGLLCERYDASLETCMKCAVKELETKYYIKTDELQVLLGLGENIGSLDLKTQLHTIEHYQRRLDGITLQAKEKVREKAKVHMVLGATIGIFLSIVLL